MTTDQEGDLSCTISKIKTKSRGIKKPQDDHGSIFAAFFCLMIYGVAAFWRRIISVL